LRTLPFLLGGDLKAVTRAEKREEGVAFRIAGEFPALSKGNKRGSLLTEKEKTSTCDPPPKTKKKEKVRRQAEERKGFFAEGLLSADGKENDLAVRKKRKEGSGLWKTFVSMKGAEGNMDEESKEKKQKGYHPGWGGKTWPIRAALKRGQKKEIELKICESAQRKKGGRKGNTSSILTRTLFGMRKRAGGEKVKGC